MIVRFLGTFASVQTFHLDFSHEGMGWELTMHNEMLQMFQVCRSLLLSWDRLEPSLPLWSQDEKMDLH